MGTAQPKTVRVRDIMTPEVITLSGSTKVDDAARSLTFHQVGGAPVLDHGHIVGVVSKSDLVDPRFRATTPNMPTVREAMTRVVHAVRPGDPAMMAVRLMAHEAVHRAVVVDDHGKLVGIVSPMDVLRALARGDALQTSDPAFEERLERHADPEVLDPEPPRSAARAAEDYVDLTTFSARG
jgi:CBS-domain-containing membrane protein